MKILFLGDASNLHSTLATALRAMGHHVVLMSDEVIKVPITTLRYRQKKWLRNVTREL